MTEPLPESPTPLKTRLLRRLLPLAILASAVALVVVQMTGAISHEIELELALEPDLASRLERLDLQVTDGEDQVITLVQFRFDPEHRPGPRLSHSLQLTNGSYGLVFEAHSGRSKPESFRRRLVVEGDAAVRFQLP